MKRAAVEEPDVATSAAGTIDPDYRAKIDAKQVENILKKIKGGGIATEREQRILNAATSERTAGRPANEAVRWSADRAATEFVVDRRTIAKRLSEAGIAPGGDGKYATIDIFKALTQGGSARDRKDAQQTELLRVQTENAKRERIPLRLVLEAWDIVLQAFTATLKAAKGKTLTPALINELLGILRNVNLPAKW